MEKINMFIKAHNIDYRIALSEIQGGKKLSHWMWYIFPQTEGLGYSFIAQKYSIKNIEEAKLYMSNDILREHMFEICNALLDLKSNNALEILGYPDNLKLKSSMTLFSISNPEYDIFDKILGKFFNGEKDIQTEIILKQKR